MAMRILKIAGIVVGVLIACALGAFLYFRSAAQARLDKTFQITVAPIPIPFPMSPVEVSAMQRRTAVIKAVVDAVGNGPKVDGLSDAADPPTPAAEDEAVPAKLDPATLRKYAADRALDRARHYLESRAPCKDCHAADFGGKVIIDSPVMGKWIAPNITLGGVTKDYKPVDWVRLVRHGVKPNGKPATMPCVDYTWFSDQEISDLAFYISTLPKVDRVMPPSVLGPVYSMLIATGKIPLSAELIDHTTPRPVYPPMLRASIELGKHLGTTCTGCHGPGFSGGPIVGGAPSWPPSQNITFHDTGIAKWSRDDFRKAMHDGVRPDGSALKAPMPIAYTKNLRESEIDALYLYLKSVPPRAAGTH